MKFCKKFDDYVTNPTTNIFFIKIKATQEIDKKVTLLLRYQFFVVLLRISVIQKQEYFSLFIFEAKNGIRQVTLFQERYDQQSNKA